jgi:UDP-N-acetylglucosamine 1-carboxyvinyltransferase
MNQTTDQANEKIGQLIAQIRQDRGLTQAEFAKRLNTSQSAVNRMEHGRQNMSLDTLGRISDVLNKQLIAVAGGAVNLRIEGGHELHGEIALKTSKNAAVGLLCASLLNYGVTRFKSFPRIEEVNRIIEVLESIGVSIKWLPGNDLEIRRPEKLLLDKLDANAARKTRSVLMLIGPLMHDSETFKIPFAGGCKLGTRTVAPHFYALEELGVSIVATKGNYDVTVAKKVADRITLYEPGDTVTENLLMAAARNPEEVFIEFASANYMVQEMCFYLQKLGVSIDGIGTAKLTVRGVPFIKKNITYAPSEDPIEAMFFVSAAVTTNSSIKINRVPIEFMSLELLKLRKMGLNYDLPYFVPIASVVRGRTLIHDWMYENRAIYYTEMTKIGAQIELADPHRVFITGATKFTPADVVCPPALRPASLLLIGMLSAKGTSMLRNIYTIQRGYEDLAERLNQLGASITVLHEM